MGVAQYTWATSPLRRYVDLVNQWQIIACARHGRTAALAAPFKPKDAALFSIISGFDGAYTAYNVLGAVGWIWSMLFIGHFLGRVVPGIDKHIEPMILVIVFLSLLPALISWRREKSKQAAAPRAVPDP